MIDENQKRAILNEILKSKSFINSKLNAKLLTYLVECSINKNTPNEYSIAADVFNKDSSFNPNEDTLIRVSVYNLRKKLERYYQNMGLKTKVRLRIPKGHYEVEFFQYSKEKFLKKLLNPYVLFIPLVFLLSATVVFLLLKLSSNQNNISEQINKSSLTNLLYSDFISSKYSKIISLGDDFIYFTDFSEFNTTYVRKMYRNSTINNEEEFEIFKSKKSDRNKLKKLPFSFFNQAAILPLTYIAELLYPYNIEFITRSTSTLTTNDLKSNDIIFLGSFWTLGILEKITKELGISYNVVGEEKLMISMSSVSDSNITLIRTGVPAYDHIDYSLFLKLPGPNRNTIYLFVSFYATGSVGTVKFMTNEEKLHNLKQKFVSDQEELPNYFFVIFKSKGNNREVLSTEVLYVNEIEQNSINW